jgi:hypothetical protein
MRQGAGGSEEKVPRFSVSGTSASSHIPLVALKGGLQEHCRYLEVLPAKALGCPKYILGKWA